MGVLFKPEGEVGRDQTLRVLSTAFMDDPVERWLYPADRDYLTFFPEFLMAFGGQAFAAGTVYALDGFSAVAMWLPPGVGADGEAIVSLLTRTVSTDKHDDTFQVLQRMDEAHPTYPHWYLPWLGVDTGHQGNGLGGELLSLCLSIVDSTDLPSYLETPNPRNISFYERHGFKVQGHARSGTCPPITFMERPAGG
jgi:ribosomal protein S18 acetylase RimI-like enzyme